MNRSTGFRKKISNKMHSTHKKKKMRFDENGRKSLEERSREEKKPRKINLMRILHKKCGNELKISCRRSKREQRKRGKVKKKFEMEEREGGKRKRRFSFWIREQIKRRRSQQKNRTGLQRREQKEKKEKKRRAIIFAEGIRRKVGGEKQGCWNWQTIAGCVCF